MEQRERDTIMKAADIEIKMATTRRKKKEINLQEKDQGIPNLNGGRTWIRKNRKYREGSDIARKERSKDKYRGKK